MKPCRKALHCYCLAPPQRHVPRAWRCDECLARDAAGQRRRQAAMSAAADVGEGGSDSDGAEDEDERGGNGERRWRYRVVAVLGRVTLAVEEEKSKAEEEEGDEEPLVVRVRRSVRSSSASSKKLPWTNEEISTFLEAYRRCACCTCAMM